MTKAEKNAANKMFTAIIKNKNKKFVPATLFNKKAKPGLQLVVIPLQDVIKQWKKFRVTVEKKNV